MNDVKVLANAIRLELLTELRTARSPSVVENNRYGECLCVEVAQ